MKESSHEHHRHLHQPGLELPDAALNLTAQRFPRAVFLHRAGREIRQAEAEAGIAQLRELRRHGIQPPPAVQQCFQIAPHRAPQHRKRLGRGKRPVTLHFRRVVQQPVQHGKLYPRAGIAHPVDEDIGVRAPAQRVVAHVCGSNSTLSSSITEISASPARKTRWPMPPTRPSPSFHSVSRPSRSASPISPSAK